MSVRFGTKQGHPVQDEVKWEIIKRLTKYGVYSQTQSQKGIHSQNPSANGPKVPVQRFYRLLQQTDLDLVERYKHLVCVNLDLPMVLLYLTKINDTPTAIFIDRDRKMTRINYRMDEDLFNETLLEGEFVRNEQIPVVRNEQIPFVLQAKQIPVVRSEQPLFLISDLIVEAGQLANQRSLTYKLSYIRSLVENRYQADPVVDCYRLEMKEYVETKYLKSFYETSVEKYGELIKGVIFRPNIKSQKNFILNIEQEHSGESVPLGTDPLWADPKGDPFGMVRRESVLKGDLFGMVHRETVPKGTVHGTSVPKGTAPEPIAKESHKTALDTSKPAIFFVVKSQDNKPDVYHLYLDDQRYDLATVTSLENSLKLQQIFKHQQSIQRNELSGLYFECKYVKRFKRWEPVSQSSLCET